MPINKLKTVIDSTIQGAFLHPGDFIGMQQLPLCADSEIIMTSVVPDPFLPGKEVIKIHSGKEVIKIHFNTKGFQQAKNLAAAIGNAKINIVTTSTGNNYEVIIGENRALKMFAKLYKDPQNKLQEFKNNIKKRQIAEHLQSYIQQLINNPFNSAINLGPILGVGIKDDPARSGEQVFIVSFGSNTTEAKLFSEWAGNATIITDHNGVIKVIVGSNRASVLFNNLFGKAAGYHHVISTKLALDKKLEQDILQKLKNCIQLHSNTGASLSNNEFTISVHQNSLINDLKSVIIHVDFPITETHKASVFSKWAGVSCMGSKVVLNINRAYQVFSYLFSNQGMTHGKILLDNIIKQRFPQIHGVTSSPLVIPNDASQPQNITAMEQEIKIQDILILGHAGQANQNTWHALGQRPLILESSPCDSNRVSKILDSIKNMMLHAASEHLNNFNGDYNYITRVVTDEFSFYPTRAPLSIEEYKFIINQVYNFAKTLPLPSNVHLILSSFPILWGDGAIHNSVLYVESYNLTDKQPAIYHFSKVNPSGVDFTYQSQSILPDGKYPLEHEGLSPFPPVEPKDALHDTPIKIDSVNQYGGALKLTTYGGACFISTVGICLDHNLGVESKQCIALIQQLQKHNEYVPMQVSQVVTSHTTCKSKFNELCPIIHADPTMHFRQEGIQGKSLLFSHNMPNNFSIYQLQVETYKANSLSFFNGEILDYLGKTTPSALIRLKLNSIDNDGNTILHRILKNGMYQHHINFLRKLVWSLLNHGANPNIANQNGETAISLAAGAMVADLFAPPTVPRLPVNLPLNNALLFGGGPLALSLPNNNHPIANPAVAFIPPTTTLSGHHKRKYDEAS